MAQTVKDLPAMWETRVRFLGREDPLEKEMAIHSSTLAWKIPWMEDLEREVLHFYFALGLANYVANPGNRIKLSWVQRC